MKGIGKGIVRIMSYFVNCPSQSRWLHGTDRVKTECLRRINETESDRGPVLEASGERGISGDPVFGGYFAGKAFDQGGVRHGGHYYDLYYHCQCDRAEWVQHSPDPETEGG